MNDHDRLVQILREKSVRRGRFTLASGRESDLYVDVRATSLHAEGAFRIARLMLARLRPQIAGIGGMTLGADPIACATAAIGWTEGRPLHAFLIRKEAKDHGTAQTVEGLANLPPGTKVAVVEDTTTTGGSLLKAIERARSAGLDIAQVLTVVDREEGAREALAAAGYALEALTGRTELLAS